jgi:hypothetical protein
MALSQKRAVLCTNVGGLAEGLQAQGHGFEMSAVAPQYFSSRVQSLFNQGDIDDCNQRLSAMNLDLEQAWHSFAEGLIALAEEA